MTRRNSAGVLPEGWIDALLSEVAQINPPKPRADVLEAEAPVTFVPMAAVDADRGVVSAPEERLFGDVRKGYTGFAEGDVLLAKITPCFENGKAAIAQNLRNGVGFGSTEFHVLRPSEALLPEYLFHYVRQQWFRRTGAEHMTGTAGQARVPVDYLRALRLPVPPIAEQRRIVAALEALMASVRAACDRLASVSPILKRFRQAILAAACSGRLTADWRDGRTVGETGGQLVRRVARMDARAVEPAQALTDIPASWSWASLDELRQTGRPIIYGIIKPGPHTPDGVPYVRVVEMKDGRIDVGNLRRASRERASKFRRATLAAGDILISKDGTIGRVAVVPPELEGGNITQHVVRFAPSPELNRDYLVLAIRSPEVQAWLTGEQKGVALQGVNVEDFRRTPLPVPPISEQHEIVQRMNALFALADAVEHRVQRATARANQLTQAVRARAFNGELVPTEAELAGASGTIV